MQSIPVSLAPMLAKALAYAMGYQQLVAVEGRPADLTGETMFVIDEETVMLVSVEPSHTLFRKLRRRDETAAG